MIIDEDETEKLKKWRNSKVSTNEILIGQLYSMTNLSWYGLQ